MTNQRADDVLRKVVRRAAWRLNVIEIFVLILAAMMSLLAGAVTASILKGLVDIPYRMLWMISSILFFGIPGFFAFFRKTEEG